MKTKIHKLLDTSKWLTLYSGLAVFIYVIFDWLDLSDFFYQNASSSMLIAWIITGFIRHEEHSLKDIFNFDKFTLKKSIGVVLSPICYFLSILLLLFLFGADISRNNRFAFDSYFYNMSILIFILAFFEEILFRGFLLQFLSEKFNSSFIIILSSLLFSMAHVFNPEIGTIAMLNIFLAGIFLSILFLKTQNIIVTTSFHFIWNIGQQFILNSAISGNDIGMNFLNIDKPVNNVLTGTYIINKFGIESSVLTTLFLMIAIYYMSRISQSPYLTSLNFRRIYRITNLK